MSELTDAIDAFLAKYPDDAELTWRDKPRKADTSLTVMVDDLVTAGERWRSMPISDHDFVNDDYASVGCCTAMVRKDDGPDMCGMPSERHGDPWCRHCWPDGGSNYPPCQRHATDEHRETPMTETNDGGVA